MLGSERRQFSASVMSRSCFASYPACVYEFSNHYLNNIIFIDNSLGPLARDSPSAISHSITIIFSVLMVLLYHIIYCVVFSYNCIQPDDGQNWYWPKHVVDKLCIQLAI